ncbi:MAG: acetate uptake transporter [Oscillospiraceae bacterium]|nr:acetate uptake transporter [Oscillospiraceae bacterium]
MKKIRKFRYNVPRQNKIPHCRKNLCLLIWTNPFAGFGIEAASKVAVGYYLQLWGIFTAFMFVGIRNHNRAAQVVFCSLTVLFFLLARGDYTGIHTITVISGIVGIFCGLSAIYSDMGQILDAEFGKKIIPLGEWKTERTPRLQ